MVKYFINFLIVCLIFFSEYKIFNLPIPTVVFLFSIIMIMITNESLKSLLIKDNIKSILFIILLVTIITYVIKSVNIESIKQVYYNNSGNKPNYLYLKMVLNGCFFILTAIFFYSIGLSYRGDDKAIKKTLRYIINFPLVLIVIVI